MQTELVTTNDSALPIEIPKGSSVSNDPIEGGSCVINAAVPPREDGHVVYRTLTTEEHTKRGEEAKASIAFSKNAARGITRMQLGGTLQHLQARVLTELATLEEKEFFKQLTQITTDTYQEGFDVDTIKWPKAPKDFPDEELNYPPK